ncbi:hypothetical protein QVD17_14417 [Tagetes erecta]|uniref:Dehydrin n=1 Tax=Tagetes erecta TaxID=13708 RepID=A0AAD8P406_TARER|nr:hypothetical protein QVD17_14417 [Tagetes erecta]
MADIRDEYGNQIQLTDEHGRPVQLTDEHGVPVHLTGIATPVDSAPHSGTTIDTEPNMHAGTDHFAPTTHAEPVGATFTPTMTHSEPVVGTGAETIASGGQPPCHTVIGGAEGATQQVERTGSSSSSSSEDDGEGGRRRKKKGLVQKIKEKLPGHKNKEQEQDPEKVFTATTKVTMTTPAGPMGVPKTEHVRVEHHEEEHEKKGFIEKIKDKLPGHHPH